MFYAALNGAAGQDEGPGSIVRTTCLKNPGPAFCVRGLVISIAICGPLCAHKIQARPTHRCQSSIELLTCFTTCIQASLFIVTLFAPGLGINQRSRTVSLLLCRHPFKWDMDCCLCFTHSIVAASCHDPSERTEALNGFHRFELDSRLPAPPSLSSLENTTGHPNSDTPKGHYHMSFSDTPGMKQDVDRSSLPAAGLGGGGYVPLAALRWAAQRIYDRKGSASWSLTGSQKIVYLQAGVTRVSQR